MDERIDKTEAGTGSTPPEKPRAKGDPPEPSMCIIWSCLGCGAARLGTIDQKPEKCETCGGTKFDFAAED